MKVGTFCNFPECLRASNDKICCPSYLCVAPITFVLKKSFSHPETPGDGKICCALHLSGFIPWEKVDLI